MMPSKKTWIRTGAILAVFVALPLYWTLNPPLLAIDLANGTYRNACCDAIVLHDGEMRFSVSNRAEYKVMRDKAGPYIITKRPLGVLGSEIVAHELGGAMKTRLEIRGGCKYLYLASDNRTVPFTTCLFPPPSR
jgi:hypothetical protein